jgi:hypothetical protein
VSRLSEDFTRWREDPMTRMVFRALEARADDLKAMWDSYSWQGGMVRSEDLASTLNELRVRHDAYLSLTQLSVEDVCTNLGIEDAE